MAMLALKIGGMSCGHCVAAVRQALSSVGGVRVVQVGIGTATVEVTGPGASPGALIDAVADAGYDAEEVAA